MSQYDRGVKSNIAWVTSATVRGFDPDEDVALSALAEAGISFDLVDWHNETIDWSQYALVLPRSTWDYAERIDEFLQWIDHVAAVTQIRNSPDIMRWSVDKHYLRDLQLAGVAVTPTHFVEVGQTPEFPDGNFVIKPAIGAGSRDAASYKPDQIELAREHVERLHARGAAAMVQPRLNSVPVEGEWPLIYYNGQISHAANKKVALPEAGGSVDLYAEETNVPHTPTPEQLAVGDAVVAEITRRFGVSTYARVDVVRDDQGNYCVLEMELVEPSLFLLEGGPDAVARMVNALTGD